MQSPELVELYFQGRYKRGAILRFEMLCDDPNRITRNKFGIVLNKDLSEPETLLAISTTSQTFLSSRFFSEAVLRLNGGEYDCFPEPTIISLREIKVFPLDFMKRLCLQEKLTFEGHMSSPDMTEIDQKLTNSQLIEGAILKRII